MTRRRKWLLAIVVLVGLPAGVFWFGYIDRGHLIREKSGWRMDCSYIRFACRVCSGQVDELTYEGAPIGVPVVSRDNGAALYLSMFCPLGAFNLYDPAIGWQYQWWDPTVTDLPTHISPVELASGHYVLAWKRNEEPVRKAGTPEHWCLIQAFDEEWHLWIDPQQMTQTAAIITEIRKMRPQTGPAPPASGPAACATQMDSPKGVGCAP